MRMLVNNYILYCIHNHMADVTTMLKVTGWHKRLNKPVDIVKDAKQFLQELSDSYSNGKNLTFKQMQKLVKQYNYLEFMQELDVKHTAAMYALRKNRFGEARVRGVACTGSSDSTRHEENIQREKAKCMETVIETLIDRQVQLEEIVEESKLKAEMTSLDIDVLRDDHSRRIDEMRSEHAELLRKSDTAIEAILNKTSEDLLEIDSLKKENSYLKTNVAWLEEKIESEKHNDLAAIAALEEKVEDEMRATRSIMNFLCDDNVHMWDKLEGHTELPASTEEACIICVTNRKSAACVPCGHTFCASCLLTYRNKLKEKEDSDDEDYEDDEAVIPNCPVCKKEIAYPLLLYGHS